MYIAILIWNHWSVVILQVICVSETLQPLNTLAQSESTCERWCTHWFNKRNPGKGEKIRSWTSELREANINAQVKRVRPDLLLRLPWITASTAARSMRFVNDTQPRLHSPMASCYPRLYDAFDHGVKTDEAVLNEVYRCLNPRVCMTLLSSPLLSTRRRRKYPHKTKLNLARITSEVCEKSRK